MINKNINGYKNNIDISSKNINELNIIIKGNNNSIIIDENVIVTGSLNIFIESNNSRVHIKDYTTIGQVSISFNEDNNFVDIGYDCMFSKEILMLPSDFHSIIDLNSGMRINNKNGITIGNHVWVGARAMLLKGTKVLDNSIIGAGAIVSKKVNNNLIYSRGGGITKKYYLVKRFVEC